MTQLGDDSCTEVLKVESVHSQIVPAMNIAANASTTTPLPRPKHARVTPIPPAVASPSAPMRRRRVGKTAAPAIAPTPIEQSIRP